MREEIQHKIILRLREEFKLSGGFEKLQKGVKDAAMGFKQAKDIMSQLDDFAARLNYAIDWEVGEVTKREENL